MKTPPDSRPVVSSFAAASAISRPPIRRRWASVAFLLLFLLSIPAGAQTLFILTEDGKLATTLASNPAGLTTPVTITGVNAGEILVAIDVRPQNQELYALGFNSGAGIVQLYHISVP